MEAFHDTAMSDITEEFDEPDWDGLREQGNLLVDHEYDKLAVFVGDRPASAWFHRGAAAVVFDFEVADGKVRAITFRAEPAVLERVVRREGPEVR